MCMKVENGARTRRSFRRIRCWKVVEFKSDRGVWTGPYYAFDSYLEGDVVRSNGRVNVEFGTVRHGLHTYADKSDALVVSNRMNKNHCGLFCVVECEIPRFVRYIEGFGYDGSRQYVSEMLKVIKFV